MGTIIDRILEAKRGEVERARARVSLDEMRKRAKAQPAPRGFVRSLQTRLQRNEPAIIAEIKRASPSQGEIRADLDPAAIAASYEAAGAACLSVLTDKPFFGGSAADLAAARLACSLPVLRKDFIVDEYQVHEARSWGADCILLIMDAAPDTELAALERVAQDLGMDVLVESHDEAQLLRALALATPLVGINNRDLRTFQTRLETSVELAPRVPPERIVVAESGISRPADVAFLRKAGIGAFLVGGAFMAAQDPGKELKRLFFQG